MAQTRKQNSALATRVAELEGDAAQTGTSQAQLQEHLSSLRQISETTMANLDVLSSALASKADVQQVTMIYVCHLCVCMCARSCACVL